MKKIFCLILAVFLLAGCQPSDVGIDTPNETTAAPTETVPQEEISLPTLPLTPVIDPILPGDRLAFSNPGKARLAYTGHRSYVKYVTSVDQLPNEEALKGYDAEFFENHALVILVETVSSGSVRLDIDAICLDGDTASVKVKRTMQGDVGTADMATWMLWAQVEKVMPEYRVPRKWLKEHDGRLMLRMSRE